MASINLNIALSTALLCFKFGTAIQITVQQGTLDGELLRKSRNGTNFYEFYGIPYAKPPVEKLRFEPPQAPDSWTGVRDAKTPPPMCIQRTKSARQFDQPTQNLTVGSEDCLYLNVFTPHSGTPSNLLPVVVFIHGGGWQYGSPAQFDPMYFMDYPIVFVAIQYRLSIFGFLSAADRVLPGNMGMKDQVAALKWVRKNIRAFGGNPNLLTLMGASSGAMSVHFHMHSPLSTGLFHRAMSLGGTALNLGAMVSPQTARDRSRALGARFGCGGAETAQLVNCLRKVPAEELAVSLSDFYVWGIFPLCPFTIVVEDEAVPGAFLTEYPGRRDVVNRVPWFVGISADEGCFLTARLFSLNLIKDFLRNYEQLAPIVLFYGEWVNSVTAAAISGSIKKFYFDNGEALDRTNVKRMVQLFTDAEMGVFALEAARRAASKVPVYFYFYNHRNAHSQADFARNITGNLGVCHGDDLISFMYMNEISPPKVQGADFFVSSRLMQYAINFIYSSDPNGDTDKKIWLPVQSSKLEYLHIRTHADTMEENPFHERYTFWKNTILPLLYHMNNAADDGTVRTEL